jgi:negative regulator of sigma-B (phosphoserine phosphatase)
MDLRVDEALEYSSTIRPFPGETVSGDAVVVRSLEEGIFVAIVDVLGHGPEANKLTHVIDAYLSRYGASDVVGVMQNLHQHLKGTRGAAVGLCAINTLSGHAVYVGIGNTTIRHFGETETRLVSQDGVVGQNMRTPILQTLQLEAGDVLVLYSDGVSDRFSADNYPSILRHTAEELANNIVQRFGKDYDDAACFALRYRA